ncbi:hypothetical protein QE152_g10239 [Popillia japonica]|uniref:Uncharacterized protein n=1 Tax=Popillia japonica TaxID=7064 RepID=A0AAW1LVF5_POPJA
MNGQTDRFVTFSNSIFIVRILFDQITVEKESERKETEQKKEEPQRKKNTKPLSLIVVRVMNLTINDMLTIVVTSWHRKHICIREEQSRHIHTRGARIDRNLHTGTSRERNVCTFRYWESACLNWFDTGAYTGAIRPNGNGLMAEDVVPL